MFLRRSTPVTAVYLFGNSTNVELNAFMLLSRLQKSPGYTSGCKQGEQGSGSEDPQPELPCPTNQDILSGECGMFPPPRVLSYMICYIMNRSYRLLNSPSLLTWDYGMGTFDLDFSTLPLLCILQACTHSGSHTHKPDSCVPEAHLVLPKMHALHISHVNICVISTGAS